MDQGNTDPNNPNPNNPTPGTFSEPLTPPPASPAAPPSFMADNTVVAAPVPASVPDQPLAAPIPPISLPEPASNWSNPTTPVAESPVVGGLADIPPQQEANPFNAPAAPNTFNPFPSPTAGSTPPSPESFPSSSEPVPAEAVPTDLSNLVNTTTEATSYISQPQTPESLVVPTPQTAGGDVNQAVSASDGKGFPKIVFILGGIILLAVIGASAYFILGIGKPGEPLPTSIPAEQQSSPTPIVNVSPTPPASTQSGSFSNLPGNATVTPSAGGSKSAYDTLMQQKKAASTGSANP